MNRITIDVSKGELDFMREALETKHINMMSYLDMCENEARQPPDLSEEEFMNQVAAIEAEAKAFNYKPKKTRGRPRKGAPK